MLWKNDSPIYIQLEEKLSNDIIVGIYKPGEKLPSVRSLAENLMINPNTVVKVYAKLEEKGIITSKQNSGFFVTDKKKVIKELKIELANKNIKEFLLKMKNLNINPKETIELLKEVQDASKNK